MNSGFDLFTARNEDSQIDIASLEAQNNFTLPPLYKLFIEIFMTGEKYVRREQYFEPGYKDLFDCKSYNFYFEGENIGFSHFIEIEKSFQIYSSGSLSDRDYQNRYFPIGSADGSGLCLGTLSQDADKIFWDRSDGNPPKLVAQNIFKFVSEIKIAPVQKDSLYGNIELSQLYKNWGDKFWRVR